MMRQFLYMLKLNSGELHFVEAIGPEEAAAKLGLRLDNVKRHMPVKALLTEEEKAAMQQRFLELRKKKEMEG